MNRVHKTLWSESAQCWQAVPETAKAAGKRAVKSASGGVLASVVMGLALTGGAGAQSPPATTQLPTGGTVARGNATISQTATAQAAAMTVNQSSQRAVINWDSFNLGSAASIHFVQPNAQAVTLNRVNDNNPSQIFGRITANGQVFLSNPNGVYFSPTASVDVGALVAATHSISDDHFMAGKYLFERNGATGKVVNEGRINAALGGYVALLAPEVQNAGVVVARAGTVALAAGEAISLQVQGGGLAGITTTPSTIATLIENKLAVQAPDGQIILSAVALNKLQAGVIKNSGSIEANSLVSKGGKIFLEGDDITLASTSQIQAKGPTGGGTVLVGGDWQGSGDMRQATQVTMAAGATIDASATDKGDGGQVVMWSDVHHPEGVTRVHGSIKAEAGPNGGNGGKVETSGHFLNVGDIQVSTQANSGQAGEWLLDPYNITIATTGETTPTWATTTQISGTDASYTAAATSTVLNSSITNALATGHVTVSTGAPGSSGADTGNITLSAPLTWASNKTLTLSAAGGITGSGAVTMSGGGALVINQAGTSTFSGAISGTGSFTKDGLGVLTLNNANQNYSGTTTIAAGGLKYVISGAATFGAGNITNNGALSYSLSSTTTLANTISGTGSLTQAGGNSSAIYLTGDNTYTGSTTVTAGGLYVGNGGATGSLGSGAVVLTANTSFLNFKRNNSLVVGNDISGLGRVEVASTSTAGLSGTTAGNIILTGTNTYAGTTTVTTGNLQVGNGATTGSLGLGTVYLNANPTLGTLTFNRSDDITIANNITGSNSLPSKVIQAGLGTTFLNGVNTYFTTEISAGTLKFGTNLLPPNNVVGTGAGTGKLSLTNNIDSTFTYNISGPVGLTKDGTGTLTLGGTNSYSGTTSINRGLIKAGSTTALGTNAPIYFADVAGVGLDVNGNAISVGTLSGGGANGGTITLGPRIFSFGGDNGSGDFAGSISNTVSGNPITKTGTGTQTLSGASSFISSLIVSAGTLKLGGAVSGNYSPLGDISSGALSVSNGATFDFNGYSTANRISTAGTLINSSPIAITSTNLISASGATTIKADNGAMNLYSMQSSSQTVTLDGSTGGNFSSNFGTTSFKPNLVKKGSGTWTLNGANVYLSTNAVDIQAGTLKLGANAAIYSVTSTTIGTGATFEVASNNDIGITSLFSGAGTLLKSGAANSTLRLSHTGSTHTGPITVSAGTLAAGSATTSGANNYLGLGTITVQSGAVLDVSGKTLPNNIILYGTGINGNGALINGATATSATSVLNGTLTLGSDSAIVGGGIYGITLNNSSASAITSNNYSLTLGGATGGTLMGVFGGTGGITKTGAGTWTLSGANTYAGETAVNAGTLAVTKPTGLGSTSGGTTVAYGATLALNFSTSPTTISENVHLSGPGVYTTSYAGAMASTGTAAVVNYAGTMTLDGTTLVVGSSTLSRALNITNAIQGGMYNFAKQNTVNLAATPLAAASTGSVMANYAFVRPTTSSLTYGDTPNISYALYTTGMGTVLSAATATGTPVFTGAPTATSNAGSYQLTYDSGLTAVNYALFSGNAATLAVNPKVITLAATPASKIYGATDPVLSATVTAGNLSAGDAMADVTGVMTRSAGQNVGNYNMALGTGIKAANYTITFDANNQAFSITKAPLTVTANNASKTYGDANPTLSATVSGFVNGETLATSGVSGAGSASTTATTTTGAGNAVITAGVGTLVASNYDFSNLVNGTLTINKAPLTVTANNASKTYGDANPALSATVSGFVNGETLATSGVSGAGSATTTATTTTAVGNAVITAGVGTLAASNYDFSNLVNGTLTINKANLSQVTASKTYDGLSTVTFGQMGTIAGVNGETFTATMGTASISDKNVATVGKTLTDLSGLTLSSSNGGVASNYNLNSGLPGAGSNNVVSISAATLAVTGLTVVNKVYDGTTAATLGGAAAISPVAGDVVTLSGAATGSFANANAGVAKAITTTGLSIGGADASNYSLVQQTGLSADITKAPLTVTANNASKTYGDANPALSATVSGFVNGETWATSGVSGAGSATTTATTTTAVGNAVITAGVGTLAASNYDFSNLVNGTLTIQAGKPADSEVVLVVMKVAQEAAPLATPVITPPVISVATTPPPVLTVPTPPDPPPVISVAPEPPVVTVQASPPPPAVEAVPTPPAPSEPVVTVQASPPPPAVETVSTPSTPAAPVVAALPLSNPSDNTDQADNKDRAATSAVSRTATATPLQGEQVAYLRPAEVSVPTVTPVTTIRAEAVAPTASTPSLANASPQPSVTSPASTLVAAASPEPPRPAPTLASVNTPAAAPAGTGVLAITILRGNSSQPTSAGVAFEQNADTVSLRATDAPPLPASSERLVFTDRLTTFMVANGNGTMVEFQGGLVNNRMVIVAPSVAAKQVAQTDMNTVLAAAVVSLGRETRVMLAQLDGVVFDLR